MFYSCKDVIIPCLNVADTSILYVSASIQKYFVSLKVTCEYLRINNESRLKICSMHDYRFPPGCLCHIVILSSPSP